MVPSDKRFLVLFTFLKKNRDKKIMVFFSSCHSVKYHSELLNYIDLNVMDIHVSMRYVVFIEFVVLEREQALYDERLKFIECKIMKLSIHNPILH